MNREEFNKAMNEFGRPLPDAAKVLIRFVPDCAELTDGPFFNFVPVGDGLYEIMQPTGRGSFFPASDGPDGKKFVGTLEEAYQWVYEDQVWWCEQSERVRAEVRARKEGPTAPSDTAVPLRNRADPGSPLSAAPGSTGTTSSAPTSPDSTITGSQGGGGRTTPRTRTGSPTASPTPAQLHVGDTIERITFVNAKGELTDGAFASPVGTPFQELSLPPDRPGTVTVRYEVLKPLPDTVRTGTIAPWFGQPGGGTQYYFPEGLKRFAELGYLKVVP